MIMILPIPVPASASIVIAIGTFYNFRRLEFGPFVCGDILGWIVDGSPDPGGCFGFGS